MPTIPRRTRFLSSILRSRRVGAVALGLALLLTAPAPELLAQKKPTSGSFAIVPITVQSVTLSGNQLLANLLVGTQAIQVPLTLTARPAADPTVCPVLDLSLGPINLTLLGLSVDTSRICLKITAQQGGGLLGNLLCQLGQNLNAGALLGDALAATGDVQTILNGLTQLLNNVFQRLTSSDAVTSATCTVLTLAIGPLNLNLLGLVVELDNCAGGPVTLAITANPAGGILGDLLCSLTDLLNNPSNTTAINTLLRNIAKAIGTLI
jgi:hypothetical protein